MPRALTLEQAAAANPLPGFADWWPMGAQFTRFMSKAILQEWRALPGNPGGLSPVRRRFEQYVEVVYGREAAAQAVEEFADLSLARNLESGEFDALSYAFFCSAFELIAALGVGSDGAVRQDERRFTRRVGRALYAQLHDHLDLELSGNLSTAAEVNQLRGALQRVGDFLLGEGYLRDHFAFRFDVHVEHGGHVIRQSGAELVDRLSRGQAGYALYEMGYPAILPSAVYLYQTMGEAQHHSSRTMEELFARIGFQARETDDFDPSGFPPDRVVELWEIRRPDA